MGLLSGKNGLVVGIANKRSLAWSIAKAADEAGARLTLSYATERFEANTRKLSDTLSAMNLVDSTLLFMVPRSLLESHFQIHLCKQLVLISPRHLILVPTHSRHLPLVLCHSCNGEVAGVL